MSLRNETADALLTAIKSQAEETGSAQSLHSLAEAFALVVGTRADSRDDGDKPSRRGIAG